LSFGGRRRRDRIPAFLKGSGHSRKETAMDYGKLHKFVRDHGEVKVYSSGKEQKLKSGDFDTVDLVEKAERFEHEGKTYTKAEMESLVRTIT
jgi:hypothetical protein